MVRSNTETVRRDGTLHPVVQIYRRIERLRFAVCADFLFCRGALRGTPNYAVLQALGETEVRCPMCLDQAVDEVEQADNKTVWIGRLDALMHHVESGHGTPSIG